jgi:hypothetical protein
MAFVIARIWRAEERERGECAQAHQSVNGEKLFMSLSSADCTEVEYATELGTAFRVTTSSRHQDTQYRQTILHSGRGAEDLHRTYKWSWILQATKPRLAPDLFL